MFKKFIVATTAVAVAATPLLVGMPAASAAPVSESTWRFTDEVGVPFNGERMYAFAKPGLGLFRYSGVENYKRGIIGSAVEAHIFTANGLPIDSAIQALDYDSIKPTFTVTSGPCLIDPQGPTASVVDAVVTSYQYRRHDERIAVASAIPGDCTISSSSGDVLNVTILPVDHITAPVNLSDRAELRYRGEKVENIAIPASGRGVQFESYFDDIPMPYDAGLDGRRTSVISGPCVISKSPRYTGGLIGEYVPTDRSNVYLYGTTIGDCVLRHRYGSFYKDIPVKVKNGGEVVVNNPSDSVRLASPDCDTPLCAGEADRNNSQVAGPPPLFNPQGSLNNQPNSVPTVGPRGAAPVIIQLEDIKKVKAVTAQSFKKFSPKIKSKDRRDLKKFGKQNTKAKNTVLVTLGYAGFNAKNDRKINAISSNRAKNMANTVLKDPAKSTLLAKGKTPAQLKKLLGKKLAKKIFKKGGNRVAITMAVTLK